VPRRERTAPEPPKRRSFVNTDRFEGLQRFIRETMAEIRKVIWPDRETTRNLTLVVIAVSVVLGILLGGIDYVLFQLFEALP
jgi:preprotein translocase subunit SecE